MKKPILLLGLIASLQLGLAQSEASQREPELAVESWYSDLPVQVDGEWIMQFLSQRNLTTLQWKRDQSIESLTSRFITYRFSLDGYQLEQAFLKVHETKQGTVIALHAFLPDPSQLPSQTLPVSEDISPAIISRRFGGSLLEQKDQLHFDGQSWTPVKVLTILPTDHPVPGVHYLDAMYGHELFWEEDAHYLWHLEEDTTGTGRVFNPNPCTVADVAYGDLFVDSMDAHQAVFDGLMDTVILQDIYFDQNDNLFKLQGPYVQVESRAANSPDPITSTDGRFLFDRNESGFEDVMVYYHIDRYQRYIQSLGFTNLQNGPLSVDAHGFASDVSAFVPNNGNSYLLFGEGNVDDAEDADVIIHEYAHALSYAAAPETNSVRERRGIDEGMADYFAAGYSYDITPNRWQLLFNWDGHNEFWNGRVANIAEAYPPANSLSIYAYGSIWVSALMKMRLEIGAVNMDQMAAELMYTFFAGMTMEQAARELFVIDSLMFNDAHRDVIRKHFCIHNIDADPAMPCLVVHSADWVDRWAFSIYPNPNAGKVLVEWNPQPGTSFQVEVLDLLGQHVYHERLSSSGQAELSLDVADGWYLLRFSDEQGHFLTRRIGIFRK